MKPLITCKDFQIPDDLHLFMKEAIGEILKVSPYDSHFEAVLSKDRAGYLMNINIYYTEGRFSASANHIDLRCAITQGTADIFTQVRSWWKTRFSQDNMKTDWSGDIFTAGQKEEKKQEESRGNEEPEEPDEEPKEEIRKTLRVLVVDDDIESVTPLELCLEKLVCETFIVSNGFEAIHEIVSGDRVYDLVILDWNMPGMTGGQALINAQRVIFHAPTSISHWGQSKLPIITFSSKARSEIDIPICEDFKHIDHWEKPVSYIHLLNQAKETFAKI